MKTNSQFALWLSRIVLLIVVVLYGVLGIRNFTMPVQQAESFNMSLNSATAVTNFRADFGGYHLTVALISLFCCISASRVLLGLYFVVMADAIAVAIRFIGLAMDGMTHLSLRVLVGRSVILILGIIAIFFERARQQRELRTAAQAG